MKLVYSEDAIADLMHLRAFIAEKAPVAAERIGKNLVERLQQLAAFTEMGRAVESAPDPQSIRDMVFGDYIVRYSIHSKTVVILRVWHHFEDWKNL